MDISMKQIQLGSVCSGTHRTEDLIPTLADELSTMEFTVEGVELLRQVEKFLGAPNDTLPDWDSEDAIYILDELFNKLDEHAPPHMYFGALEGDGADFGWWPRDFDGCHTIPIEQGKNGEGTFVDTECNLYVEINDHGNTTVKELGGNIIWDCV